jgi:NADPH-dependent 2,4-dienoyl-CoA reductase/sulfur reductase-like enzyme
MIKGTEVEDLPAIVSYLEGQIRRLGVRVNLGVEADADRLISERPDAVILAAGGRLTLPDIPGCRSPLVVSHLTLHRRAKFFLRFVGPSVLRKLTRFYLPIGQRVVIVGGAIQGCEIGEFLIKRRRRVTILEASDKMGSGIPEINRKRVLFWLAKRGAHLLSGVVYEEISEKGITLITKEGERQTLEADTIVLAIPTAPSTALLEALKGKVPQVYLIGDAKEPQDIRLAIEDGFTTAYSL